MGGRRENQADLPAPYSPNLNLIERLWKFLRKEIINTKFYRTKHEFRDAVLKFFDNIASYRKETQVASNSELPHAQFAIHFWLTISKADAIQKIHHSGWRICYSEGILYPFGHALGIGIKVSLQLLAKQADLPTLKTSPITLITIFQKTVRFSLNLKILVLIDGSDVYAHRATASKRH